MHKKILLVFLIVFVFMLTGCKDNNPIDVDGDKPPCAYCPYDFRLTDFDPAWSPDGNTVAYVHGDTANGKTGIYLVDISGNNKRIIYASAGAYSPAWSPDGKWIAFSDKAQIYKMKINGDSLIQLTTEGRNFFPAWSPDGQLIVHDRTYAYPESSSVQGIWLLNSFNGSNRRKVSTGRFPDWHPNGASFIFIDWFDNKNGGILHLNLKDGLKVLLLNGQGNDIRFPKYSPDGTKIAFTSQPYGSSSQILVMNSDGSNLKQLTNTQGYNCDWSPDGTRIVYTDSRNVSGSLWLMNSDGSAKRQLTFN